MDHNLEKRTSPRKLLDPIHVTQMTTADRSRRLARHGTIVDASATGMLIRVCRSDLAPHLRQQTPAVDALVGIHVMMTIVEMDLVLDGTIARAGHPEPGCVDLAVDLTDTAPTYWRECLVELLPGVGEIDAMESS